MESLTRLVTDSLARHGFDRPMDPRRLQWSRWFRCDSPHSLLVVPSKPGIFAIAEEIMDLGPGKTLGSENTHSENIHVETAALGCPERSSAPLPLAGAARSDSSPLKTAPSAPELTSRRLLAVLQFSEDDDMAFTLDRMFTRINPMRARLASGKCFLRFVVIEDQDQRRTICAALNQWMLSSAEKATGIPAGFSSLELSSVSVARAPSPASLDSNTGRFPVPPPLTATDPVHSLDSGANKNLHCPSPLPSGF
jgi:hypothetical protein